MEVVGKCLGTHSDSEVLYSEAAVSVFVIKLEGVEIRASSTYILEGSGNLAFQGRKFEIEDV